MLTKLIVALGVTVLIVGGVMLLSIVGIAFIESKAGDRFFGWLDKVIVLIADRFLGGKS